MKALKSKLLLLVLFLAGILQAQVSDKVISLSPPPWGPAGYSLERYYYLPDVTAYYDVQLSEFIYLDNGSWIRKSRLPDKFRNYDLYNGFKVVMANYSGYTPYTHFSEQRRRYVKGYNGQVQKTNRERPEPESNRIKLYQIAQSATGNNVGDKEKIKKNNKGLVKRRMVAVAME